MPKANFYRGLSPQAVTEVGKFLDSTEIGQHFKGNTDFQICIREDYINIYFRGCSIVNYDPLNGKFSVHSKYLGKTDSEKYVGLELKGGDLSVDGLSLLKIANNPVKHFEKYIRGEKSSLAEYLGRSTPNLIDLEVAFTREKGPQEKINKRKFVANRIDLAVITDDLKLQLIEVKVDTDSRLRSEIDGDQEILTQMGYYDNFITGEGLDIIKSYKTVAQNILDLGLAHKVCSTVATAEKLLSAFSSSGTLDPTPYMLMVDTGKNPIGKKGVNHWDRLLKQFDTLGYQPPRTWKQ